MEFCSLGPKCHSAKILQYINKKKESYPFDWIYSNLPMITHCIKDKFRILMDKKYYVNPDLNLKMQTHTFYFPSTITMFNHHNPLAKEDYEYYRRCISRFNTLLTSEKSKIFLYFSSETEDVKTYVNEFNSEFSKITKNYKFICMLYKKAQTRSYKIEYHKEIIFIDITVTSKTDGVIFEDKEDNKFIEYLLNEISGKAFPVNFQIF